MKGGLMEYPRYIFIDTLSLRPMEPMEYDLLTRGIGRPFDINKGSLKWSQEAVNTLKVICEETDSDIVVIDKNKRFLTIADYENMFKLYGWMDAPIAGKTPSKKGDMFLKGEEIDNFLRSRNTMDYVIVDIVPPFFYESFAPAMVRINHKKALQPDDIEVIIRTMLY